MTSQHCLETYKHQNIWRLWMPYRNLFVAWTNIKHVLLCLFSMSLFWRSFRFRWLFFGFRESLKNKFVTKMRKAFILWQRVAQRSRSPMRRVEKATRGRLQRLRLNICFIPYAKNEKRFAKYGRSLLLSLFAHLSSNLFKREQIVSRVLSPVYPGNSMGPCRVVTITCIYDHHISKWMTIIASKIFPVSFYCKLVLTVIITYFLCFI